MVDFLLTIPGIGATLPDWNTGPLRSAARARSVPILKVLVRNYLPVYKQFPGSLVRAWGSTLCAILRTNPPRRSEGLQREFPRGTPEAKPRERAGPVILADDNFSALTQSVLELVELPWCIPLGPRVHSRLLLQATKTQNSALLTWALQFPQVNVNTYDKRADTPLILCCRNYDTNGMALVLAHPPVNVNWQNAFGETALSGAASLGQDDVVRGLLPLVGFNLEQSHASLALTGAIVHGHSAITDRP
jgi:hypothetical protein